MPQQYVDDKPLSSSGRFGRLLNRTGFVGESIF